MNKLYINIIQNLKSWEGFLLACLVLIIITNSLLSPEFLTLGNQINLFQLSIEKIIVALFMTYIIINAEIDLSVASIMGLGAVAFGFMFQNGVPAQFACVIVLFIGGLCGAFNGFFIAKIGLPSLVVTLATLIGFRGLARVLVEDRGVTDFPEWFDALGQTGFIGIIPFSLVSFAFLFIL
nr:ABC transporter permease [Alphaproteobacteria bacterium]